MAKYIKYNIFLLVIVSALYSCGSKPDGNLAEMSGLPLIDPDYSGITIPFNIAPLNFKINEPGAAFSVTFAAGKDSGFEVHTKNGIVKIPLRKWKRLLLSNKGNELLVSVFKKDDQGSWVKFKPITDFIAQEPVDPFITYRFLYPGYESWKEISIIQRTVENFKEHPIIENSVAEQNCVNCHSYNNGFSEDFLFHIRGSLGGTLFYKNGDFRKINLKTKEMKNGAVYPRWHPSGRFVAFSSNRIVQQFHSALNKKVEVTDLESSLVLYDVDRNEIRDIDLTGKETSMDTYPEWSPDGKYLYFCRAPLVSGNFDYQQIHYDLFRVSFDPASMRFGEPEMVFNASGLHKSVSFPRISPEGEFLVLTLHDYGCFPIWHKEADLWSVDLKNMKASEMTLNSDQTDSYHSWSSNGRWLVFSSKRIDGLTARPFISYIDKNGNPGKPFILPQRDPELYGRMLKSFNVPEFSTLKIDVNPGRIGRSARMQAIQAKWSAN